VVNFIYFETEAASDLKLPEFRALFDASGPTQVADIGSYFDSTLRDITSKNPDVPFEESVVGYGATFEACGICLELTAFKNPDQCFCIYAFSRKDKLLN
jgi:hypothetical protein